MIKEQDKTLENKIHFIFYVLERKRYFEGENLHEFLKSLNASKYPVFFLVNRARKNRRQFYRDIDPLVGHLCALGYKNLANPDNFINVNFKEEYEMSVHGIGDIFKKLKAYIYNEKFLDKNIKDKKIGLLRDFNSEVLSNKSFNSYKNDDKLVIKNLKNKINFNERMKIIMDMTNQNSLFSKINIHSLLINGIITGQNFKKVIISLSNLRGIFPSVSENIPAITILQAVMVKEIGEGYGLDMTFKNPITKFLLNNIRNNFSSSENLKNRR